MRVGKQVTILDGKVSDPSGHPLSHEVTWIGDPPPTKLDYIATVGSEGKVGGNVTLVEGGTFINPVGLRPLEVIETYGATISFNLEVCWHLDDSLCAAVSAGSVCGLPPDEADVQACSSCFSFQAAVLHEVGHILGLSHPDTASKEICTGAGYCNPTPGENSHSTGLFVARMNATSCKSPWDDVRAGIPPGAAVDPQTGVRPSVMNAFTLATTLLCLQQDDLEALHVLYPDCTYARQAPLCEPMPVFTCPSTAPSTAIIVGGVVAGVAIVCLTIVVVVKTLAAQKTRQLRQLSAETSPTSSATSAGEGTSTSTRELRQLPAGTSPTSSATSAGGGTSTSTVHVERLWL